MGELEGHLAAEYELVPEIEVLLVLGEVLGDWSWEQVEQLAQKGQDVVFVLRFVGLIGEVEFVEGN